MPQLDILSIASDPNFIQLSKGEHQKVLDRIDEGFRVLPQSEKDLVLRKLVPSEYGKITFGDEWKPPTVEEETLQAPTVDPVTAFVSGGATAGKLALGAGASAIQALGRGAVSGLSAAIGDIPVGTLTDEAGAINEDLVLPFNIIFGVLSGVTIENAIENAITGTGSNLSGNALRRAITKIKSAIKSGDYSGEAAKKAVNNINDKLLNSPKAAPYLEFARKIGKKIKSPPNKDLNTIKPKAPSKTKVGKAWREFWTPMSTIPAGNELLSQRNRQLGDLDTAERIAKKMYTDLDKFELEVRKDIFRFLNGQVEVTDFLPKEALRLAKRIRERTNTIGRMLVKRNIISEETFEVGKDKYVHYLYAKHILGDDADLGGMIRPTGKLNLSYSKQRKDMTDLERQAIGLIEDAEVAVPVGMGKALNDIAKYDYLKKVGDNPEWTWMPSLVDLGDGKKMGIGKLAEEVSIATRMVDELPDNQAVKDRFVKLATILEKAQKETKNLPADFKQLPVSKSFGNLSGAFVRTPIYDDIVPLLHGFEKNSLGRAFSKIAKINEEGLKLFKVSKAALNVPTAARNIISNVIQNNMRGRPLQKILSEDIPAALIGMKAKDADFIMARRHGLFRTNFSVVEINDIINKFKVKKGRVFTWSNFMEKVGDLAQYYGKIDDISKFAIYKQLRKNGRTVSDAVLEAQKWGMDYSLASRSVKSLRRSIIPFASYQYKIAPLIAETIRERPWIIAKYAAIPTLLAPLAADFVLDMDEKDWKKLRKQLPTYIKKNESYMILPWKSEEGHSQWINTEYFFPWQNGLAIFRDIKEEDYANIVSDIGVGHPFLDLYIGLRLKKDPFTKRDIYNELDSKEKQWADIAEFIYNKWAPSMVTRYGALGYTTRVNKKDKYNRTITPGQALGRWFGGNIISVSPEQTARMKAARIKELQTKLYRILLDPSRDPEEKQEAAKRFKEEVEEVTR